MKQVMFIAAATLFASACSGPVGGTSASPLYNRHQCGDLDWRMAGLADGIRGYGDIDARFASLEMNCAKHGMHADRARYDAGYAEGRRKAGG